MRLTRFAAVALVLTAWPPDRLIAWQCPDGTPPPCRAATPAARRPAPPPLDDRTWIVLPFENVARATDIDWLRDASVNLLYLDMSRWRDIRVIDDERVADFMREVPQGRGPMGLQTGMAVARRAGAGKLVMGDLLKIGNRTRVIAKVFDVRTGQRMRSIQEETNNPDSIMAVFGRLARGILNVAPPAGATVGTIGTTSLVAYQEYLAGVQALNAFNLTGARQHFTRAIEVDSTFALAHYKLSVTIGWENPNVATRLRHAQVASRFAGNLPVRERTLIAAQLAQSNGRWADACAEYHSLIRADSSDVEAWYNVGECEYHDQSVVAVPGDTSRLMFRGDINRALRAFRRTLELDPSFHLAFAHIPDILHSEQRAGCLPPAGQNYCGGTFNYIAIAIRQGDSIVLRPVLGNDGAAIGAQFIEARRYNTRRANFALASELAAEWVRSGPNESRAHMALSRALLRTGDIAGADREARLVRGDRAPLERISFAQDQVEIALKLGRYADAVAAHDSIELAADSLRLGQIEVQIGIMGITLGRFDRADATLQSVVPPPQRAFLAVMERLIAGVMTDSTERVVRGFARTAGPQAVNVFTAAAMFGLRWVRTWDSLPPLDTSSGDPRIAVAAHTLRGDTAAQRRALIAVDSAILGTPLETPENGMLLAAAEGYLMLRDSAAALERLLEYHRRWPHIQPLERLAGGFAFSGFTWARTYLLLGDVAAGLGRNDVAAAAYRRAAGIWQSADAAVQPMVQRAREAATRLGG